MKKDCFFFSLDNKEKKQSYLSIGTFYVSLRFVAIIFIQVQGSVKPSASSNQPRVSNILDTMTSSRKLSPLSGSSGKPNKGPVLKPLAPRPKTKVSSLPKILKYLPSKARLRWNLEILCENLGLRQLIERVTFIESFCFQTTNGYLSSIVRT